MDIKVKAWDAVRKQMLTDQKWVEFYFVHGVLKAKNYDRKGNEQELKVVQSTGLKDRNGIEIYNGDVINDHVGLGVVVWNEENAAFKVSYRGENKGRGKWFADYNLKGEYESIEIICNIYESPELND